MVSHSDNGEHDFEDLASAHGRLLPWSDDQTTATYQLSQLSDLQHYARANTQPRSAEAAAHLNEASWLDTSSGWDPAPIILEVTEAPRARVTHAVATPGPLAPPRPYLSRGLQRQQPRSARGLPQQQPSRDLENRARAPKAPLVSPSFEPNARDEEANPFASPPSSLGAWLLATLAVAALFAGVLFGRVLLRTSMSEAGPLALGSTTAAAIPAPVSPAIVEPALAPEVRVDPQPPAPEPAAPAAARKPAQRRAGYARVAREDSDVDLESPERAAREPSALPASSPRQHAANGGSEPLERDVLTDEPAAQATLRINSRPWSRVFVDGRLVGTTPQLGVSVAPGQHTIRLVNPDFEMAKTFTVDVAAGESLTRIETLQD